eukprot:5797965-Pyramimonas_sp.AAC.1
MVVGTSVRAQPSPAPPEILATVSPLLARAERNHAIDDGRCKLAFPIAAVETVAAFETHVVRRWTWDRADGPRSGPEAATACLSHTRYFKL